MEGSKTYNEPNSKHDTWLHWWAIKYFIISYSW